VRTLSIASSCSPGSTWDSALDNKHPQVHKHIMRLHPILPLHHRVHVCKKTQWINPRNIKETILLILTTELFLNSEHIKHFSSIFMPHLQYPEDNIKN
jgi:hypothetical protein